MKKRTKRAIKSILRFLGVVFLLILLAFFIQRAIGYKILESTNSSLINNLASERAEKEELKEEVVNLKKQLENKTLEANTSEQKNTEVVNDAHYLQAKFPSDGMYYVDSYENTFYTDSMCTKPIESKPRFMSPEIDENLKSQNGFSVKALRLDDGSICYCQIDTLIYLVTESEWEEYVKEQEAREATE